MILWELLIGFLRVGCFAFGGAYSAIPLIREIVLANGWLTEDALTGMIAVSESTPGPIMVNLATYVGLEQAGIPGACVATFAVVVPSFVIILLAMALFRALMKHPLFQVILGAVKPCIAGIILAVGTYMIVNNTLRMEGRFQADLKGIVITGILFVVLQLSKKKQKKLSPQRLILFGAIVGMLSNMSHT